MANYKRGRPRSQGKGNGLSTVSYRKKHGLKPIILPDWEPHRWGTPEYFAHQRWRESMRDIWWPEQFNMMANHPRWWDIMHHTRPRRAKEKALTRKVLKGAIDAENVPWPLEKKPHIYYW